MYDYEHFLETESQRFYIHTLPKTLNKPDIQLEVRAQDGVMEQYFIKKYSDDDTGNILWDIVIVRDNRLKDKLVLENEEGIDFIANLIEAG